DLVFIAGPMAEHDEDGKDAGGNGDETPRPWGERARQCEARKNDDDDSRSQRRIRNTGADRPGARGHERAIKRPQAVDDAVAEGMVAGPAPASEPVKCDVEGGEQREGEEARD